MPKQAWHTLDWRHSETRSREKHHRDKWNGHFVWFHLADDSPRSSKWYPTTVSISTLPETNTALENWSLEVEDYFPCRIASFQSAMLVSGRVLSNIKFNLKVSGNFMKFHPRLLVSGNVRNPSRHSKNAKLRWWRSRWRKWWLGWTSFRGTSANAHCWHQGWCRWIR